MVPERLANLAEKLIEMGIDHALLTSVISLRYFTGYRATVELEPSPMTPLLGVFLWIRGEQPTLFLADMEPGETVHASIAKEGFSSYTFEKPLHAIQDLSARLLQRLKNLPRSNVAIEAEEVPGALVDPLRWECPQLQFRDVKDLLSTLRMVKDAEEIQTMREALELCDIGQEMTKRLAQVGRTEIEIYSEIHRAMEAREGGRVPILADVISGPRSALTGGPPSARRLEEGDLLIVDLVPRHHGYWGDSCNTCSVSEPRKEYVRAFNGISAVLADAIAQVRPGLRACDLDESVRTGVRRLGGSYPHHTGHGLGISWHEEPRIVPYNTTPLQADMIIALEPGMYFEGRWGLRLEYVMRVTATGAELLSKYKHTL